MPVTWPPSLVAAVNADREPEVIPSLLCSKKTNAWGDVAEAYDLESNARQGMVVLARNILSWDARPGFRRLITRTNTKCGN